MYKYIEQESQIIKIEYTGEYEMYSCVPHVVNEMLKVAASNQLAIKVMDILDGKPQGVAMVSTNKEIVNLIMDVM